MLRRARFLVFCLWIACLSGLSSLLVTAPAAAEVKYSVVDRSTVRVLALGGVEMATLPASERNRRARIAIAKGGHGSGVKLTADGVVLTAAHVVEGSRFVVVKELGSDKAYPARVIYSNRKLDVAFLLIPGVHQDHLPLPEAAVPLTVRQTVFAVGYPLDASRSAPQSSRGVVAGMLPSGDLQLGISINPGNSGGPVIDERDRLVGIAVRGADPTKGAQGLGEAVPVDRILPSYRAALTSGSTAAEARQSLSRISAGDWAAAELVARLAEQSALIGSGRKLLDIDFVGFREAARVAYPEHKGSAELLAILAGHYWNESASQYARGQKNWEGSARYAKVLSKRALELDDQVGLRSPFVLDALGRAAPRSARAVSPEKEAPQTAAGFTLGSSVEEVQLACKNAKHHFMQGPRGYRCSGPAERTSLTVEVYLEFCAGELCRIDLLHVPSRNGSITWQERFLEIKRHYERRFGASRKDKVVVPPECKRDILPCLERGEAVAIYSWQWDERSLQLSMGRIEGKPVIRVSHRPRP